MRKERCILQEEGFIFRNCMINKFVHRLHARASDGEGFLTAMPPRRFQTMCETAVLPRAFSPFTGLMRQIAVRGQQLDKDRQLMEVIQDGLVLLIARALAASFTSLPVTPCITGNCPVTIEPSEGRHSGAAT